MSDKILPFSKVATTPANGEPVHAKVELLLADSFGDPETLLNSRDWLRRALESSRAKIVGGGIGCGRADLDIELEGCAFNVSIRPIARGGVMDPHDAQAAAVRHNNALVRGTYEEGYSAGNAEGIKEGMRMAAEIAGAEEDQFIALAGEAADNTMRKHYSALASGAGTAAAAILKEAGE